ncbi:unnamed protein product [Arabis nemorensis]|uniref:Uncharacterized protein n=1 Tax=Arabis nemorensis TaxID=586526 RepID=A0A565BBD9_9BRAS|nr:unnamed protein product [Arabis nemorensis]
MDLNRILDRIIKIIQSSLTVSAFRKTHGFCFHDLWDLLKKSNDEAKLSKLEKKFDALEMYEEEPMDNYLGRVVEGFEKSGNPK